MRVGLSETTTTMLSPFLSLPLTCDQATQKTRAELSQAGMSVVQTFNLHTARLALRDCACPSHGTESCDCHVIILLVYGETPEPANLLLHGNNGQTWVSITDPAAQQVDAALVTRIRRLLENTVCAD